MCETIYDTDIQTEGIYPPDGLPSYAWDGLTRCAACLEECRAIEVDFGIGAWEYWGATGWDSQIHTVSNCCEADLINHE